MHHLKTLCYLLHLQAAGLAFTSIKWRLTALAAYLQNREQTSIVRIPLIKAFLQGLKNHSTQSSTHTSVES